MPTQIDTSEPRDNLNAAIRDGRDITIGKPLDRPIRQYPPAGKVTATEALEEDRAER